ncbi:MAG TPA: nuclear transport factor 2 family protein, partial [Salinimicrobium sp.]|nr:nuclear transport factor 2 family protein [Salinimicrobium sp.]
MTDDAVFLGTDASENWTLEEFKAYSKPFFEKGKAWTMTASDRNIYISDSGKIAWFDELLNSSMGMIRGSGV